MAGMSPIGVGAMVAAEPPNASSIALPRSTSDRQPKNVHRDSGVLLFESECHEHGFRWFLCPAE